MTDADRQAARRLCEEATPGKLGLLARPMALCIVDDSGNPAPRTGMRPAGDPFPHIARMAAHYAPDEANAAKLIAGWNYLLPALDQLDAQDAEIARLKATLAMSEEISALAQRDKNRYQGEIARLRASMSTAIYRMSSFVDKLDGEMGSNVLAVVKMLEASRDR